MAKGSISKSGTNAVKTSPKSASSKPLGRKKGSAKKLKEVTPKKGDEGKMVVKGRDDSPTDTIYLGHVPPGFGEAEMRKFFMQFGDVSKLKLFRSKKTKGSKGYAFIKFDSVTTAGTVSEAMNGYFMGDRQLVSEVVPKWKCHKGMFLQPRKRKEGDDKSDAEVDTKDDEENQEKVAKMALKAKKNLASKQKKLAALGIDYDFVEDLVNKDVDNDNNNDNGDSDRDESEISKRGSKKSASGGSSATRSAATKKRKAVPTEENVEGKEKKAVKGDKEEKTTTKRAKTTAAVASTESAATAKGKTKGKSKAKK